MLTVSQSSGKHDGRLGASAPGRQVSTHLPQAVQVLRSKTWMPSRTTWDPVGQTAAQRPQPVHFRARKPISDWAEIVSGLWHQRQASEQPFRKTVVRMPGPSWMANRLISTTRPVTGRPRLWR